MTIEVSRYRAEHAADWNRFVAASKNGTFLFDRGFMDYHAHRFEDHSLLFHSAGNLIALFPANLDRGSAVSHGGLSYGGLVIDQRMHVGVMLELVQRLLDYYRRLGVRNLVYKAVPHIYHRQPAEEDRYALFRAGAELFRVDMSITIDLAAPAALAKGKRHALSKARKARITVTKSEDYAGFWELLETVLRSRYAASPTHSLAEIRLLASRFAQNIALYTADMEGKIVAGTVIFAGEQVAHTQYMAASETGRETGALDAVLHHVITKVYHQRRYFDFGISTESQGRVLNEGLCRQKEALGGRGTACLFYTVPL